MKKIIFIISLLQFTAISIKAQEIFDAVKANDIEAIKTIVNNDLQLVHAKDIDGRTPLHWACRGVYFDIMKYLVEKGADVNQKDNNGVAPILSLVTREHLDGINFLLLNGADVNIQDNSKWTPLHYSVYRENVKVTGLLLKMGANVNIRNSSDRTPLMELAVRSGNPEICRILIKQITNINEKSREGFTPLYSAAFNGYGDMVDILLDNNAEIDIESEMLKYCLHRAVAFNLTRFIEKVITLGFDINSRNEYGRTLLHSAAEGGSVTMMEMFVKKGLKVNEKDHFGITPLHLTSKNSKKEAVQYLIDNGASIDQRSLDGKTALRFAEENDQIEIVNQLKKNGASIKSQIFPNLEGTYLGQKTPEEAPLLFFPGIVSYYYTAHGSVIFSPDMKEIYWAWLNTDNNSVRGELFMMKQEKGKWTKPEKVSFSDSYSPTNPSISPDGNTILFYGSGVIDGQRVRGLWKSERENDKWKEPNWFDLQNKLSITGWEVWFSNSDELFFSSNLKNGIGGHDIYIAKIRNGQIEKTEILDGKVNTILDEWGPSGGFISPNGDYMVFSSNREGGLGQKDLYVSFRKKDDSWSQAMNLGEIINTAETELWPYVTPDGKYLFYSGKRNGIPGIYWVSSKIFEELRPKEE